MPKPEFLNWRDLPALVFWCLKQKQRGTATISTKMPQDVGAKGQMKHQA